MIRILIAFFLIIATAAGDNVLLYWRPEATGPWQSKPLTTVPDWVISFDANGVPVIAPPAGGTGSGDVVGPASATSSNIAVFNGTTGKLLMNGTYSIDGIRNRANHTGTQLLSTISDVGALAALSSVASAQITDGTIVVADIADGAVTTGKILDATIANVDISASAAIADTKLATISTAGKVSDSALSSNIPLKNAANVFTANRQTIENANLPNLLVQQTGAGGKAVAVGAGESGALMAFDNAGWLGIASSTKANIQSALGTGVETYRFFIDGTTGNTRIGPGTTAPDTTLQVLGVTTTNTLELEGATANGFETALVATDPLTTDRTITFPDATGTVALTNIVNSWGAGIKQTFSPDSTTSGLNVGSVSGDPSGLANGDVWYDSAAHELTAHINGASVVLGAAGSGGNVATDVIWDAKGDLAVGTGANAAQALTLGTNGFVLTADSSTATGLKWAAGGAGDVVGPSTAVTDGRVVLFDTTTGKLLKQSTILGTDIPSKATANTFTGDLTVPTEVYNATNWDADLTVPTKDAVRDVIETLQPLDADLTSIAALTTTAFGRGVLDDADAAALQTTAGVVIGTNVQAYDADLDDLADGSLTGSKVGTGISASNVTTGTLPDAQFPATLPAISGANLTNLDATDLATGTIPVARIGTGDIGPTQLTDTGVMAAAYTSANITVDADGRITAASNGSGGSGSVATDTIFDAKGDLPVGTAADTAAKLTVGANNTALIADSSTATGLKWAPLNDTVDYDKWHIGTYTFTSNTTIVGTNIISASASGTATADSDGSSTRLKNISYVSTATSPYEAGFVSNGGISHVTHDWDVRWTGGIDTLTDVRWIGGLGEGISGVANADLPGGSAAAWFRYSTSASDTNFQCLSDDDAAGNATITNSGVTVTTGQFRFRITKTATAVTFYINGTQVAQHAATAAIPDKDASTIFVHRARALGASGSPTVTCYFSQAEIRHKVP